MAAKKEEITCNGNDISHASSVKKRTDYLNWDEYFMAVAFLSAQRSKDPHSQVMIIDKLIHELM